MWGGSKPAADGKGSYGTIDEKKGNGPFGKSRYLSRSIVIIYFTPDYVLLLSLSLIWLCLDSVIFIIFHIAIL